MAQKKKTGFKLLASPDDLSEIRKAVRKFRYAKIRKILAFAVLIILALCGTYLLMKNQVYGQARTASQYPGNISDTSGYARFADGIVRYNRDGVAYLNRENEEQWIQPTQLQNPVIAVKDEAFAVADRGGNTILIFSEDGLTGEIETALPVERLTVSDRGIVSVILKSESTPAIMTYDAAGNLLVEQQITPGTTGYPAALEISDDGTLLAVSYLYTDSSGVKSRIIYYNFGETGQSKTDNVVLTAEYENTVMAELFFMGGGRSVAVGNDSFVIYRGTDIPEEETAVTIDQEIQSVFHSDQYIGFILLNENKSGYELRLYNRLGEQLISREIPANYRNAKIDGDEVIMYDGDNCCIVTVTGIMKYEGSLSIEVQEMFRAGGLNRYYVINVDELRVIYLTK